MTIWDLNILLVILKILIIYSLLINLNKKRDKIMCSEIFKKMKIIGQFLKQKCILQKKISKTLA